MPLNRLSSFIKNQLNLKIFTVNSDTFRVPLLRGILVLVMLLSSPLSTHAGSSDYFYRVRAGDTLSMVLYRLELKPVYGKRGHLKLAVGLNPAMIYTHGDQLHLGDVIHLPVKDEKRLKEIADVLASGEVLLDFSGESNAPLAQVVERLPAEVRLDISVDESTHKSPVKPSARDNASIATVAEVSHSIELGLNYRFTELSVKDLSSGAGASIYTNSVPGLTARLTQAWSDRFHTFFKFDWQKLSFAPSANALKILATESVTQTRFTLGAAQKLSSTLELKYFVSFGSELFIRGLNSGSISIDARPLPSVGLMPKLSLYSIGHTSVGIQGVGEYLAAAITDAYQIKSGYRLGLGGYLLLNRDSGQNYQLNLGYQTRTQNTSATQQSDNEVYAGLSFDFLPLKDTSQAVSENAKK